MPRWHRVLRRSDHESQAGPKPSFTPLPLVVGDEPLGAAACPSGSALRRAASTTFTTVSICASAQRHVVLEVLHADRSGRCAMAASAAPAHAFLIARAHGRASWYVMSDIGAIEFG
jgi:hypothetical protein